MREALDTLASLLESLPDAEYCPSKIDAALALVLQWSGLPKQELYKAIREALAPEAKLPLPALLLLWGRARVVPTLRERFT